MNKKFSGVVVPMISPFKSDLTIDTDAVARITNYLIEYEANPFVLGTTGESASISKKERQILVEATVAATAGKKDVYTGISGNCFSEVVDEAKAFADLGVDALVSTMPSYYPVDDDQQLRYFELLANAVPLPLIIYNIPVTTHLSIPLEVAEQLSHHPNILGFKDSEKGADRVKKAIKLWKDRPDFSYLLGWALMSQEAMLLGADGIVPSTGNLSPGLYQTICKAAKSGDVKLAIAAQAKADQLSAIYQQDRILSRSLPVLKTMMSAYQLCGQAVLPPFSEVDPQETITIIKELRTSFGDVVQINEIKEDEY
jgi:dihydrodipicolinate synthase/N-acetylneuraminate lyase